MERCSKCKTIYSKSNFHKDITKNNVYRQSCKNCSKQYYYDNQNRILHNHKTFKKNNQSKKMLMKDRREKVISISIYIVI